MSIDYRLSTLTQLEAEAIDIIREVTAACARPVMLYSVGKDSSVMLRLARKAFAPGPLPFPLLHIDTGWKFRAMIEFRDATVRALGVRLLTHTHADRLNPFDHGSQRYTQVMKTEALKQALATHGFDAAFGGARRDEERSRAKERVVSVRDAHQQWDPRNQRPELWRTWNVAHAQGDSLRVFPLSNWTELDVWLYIRREHIEVVPLYFAAVRPVVRRGRDLILVDDERFRLLPGEQPERLSVRFRTLGCYPLTGAIESTADTLEAVVAETMLATKSERVTRVIDHDGEGSMEQKKREGYF